MKIFAPHDVDLRHFNPLKVSYSPKGIYTEAIFVTAENIGKLALEFETTLMLMEDYTPYFRVMAQRGNDENPEDPTSLTVHMGDWLLALRGEIHIFPDGIFQNTFDVEDRTYDKSVVPVTSQGQFVHNVAVFPLGQLVRVRRDGRFGRVKDINAYAPKPGQEILAYMVEFEDGSADRFHEEDLEVTDSPPKIPVL